MGNDATEPAVSADPYQKVRLMRPGTCGPPAPPSWPGPGRSAPCGRRDAAPDPFSEDFRAALDPARANLHLPINVLKAGREVILDDREWCMSDDDVGLARAETASHRQPTRRDIGEL